MPATITHRQLNYEKFREIVRAYGGDPEAFFPHPTDRGRALAFNGPGSSAGDFIGAAQACGLVLPDPVHHPDGYWYWPGVSYDGIDGTASAVTGDEVGEASEKTMFACDDLDDYSPAPGEGPYLAFPEDGGAGAAEFGRALEEVTGLSMPEYVRDDDADLTYWPGVLYIDQV